MVKHLISLMLPLQSGVVSIGEAVYVKVVEVLEDDGSGRGPKIQCSIKVGQSQTGDSSSDCTMQTGLSSHHLLCCYYHKKYGTVPGRTSLHPANTVRVVLLEYCQAQLLSTSAMLCIW
jgi:hypothetical protein